MCISLLFNTSLLLTQNLPYLAPHMKPVWFPLIGSAAVAQGLCDRSNEAGQTWNSGDSDVYPRHPGRRVSQCPVPSRDPDPSIWGHPALQAANSNVGVGQAVHLLYSGDEQVQLTKVRREKLGNAVRAGHLAFSPHSASMRAAAGGLPGGRAASPFAPGSSSPRGFPSTGSLSPPLFLGAPAPPAPL